MRSDTTARHVFNASRRVRSKLSCNSSASKILLVTIAKFNVELGSHLPSISSSSTLARIINPVIKMGQRQLTLRWGDSAHNVKINLRTGPVKAKIEIFEVSRTFDDRVIHRFSIDNLDINYNFPLICCDESNEMTITLLRLLIIYRMLRLVCKVKPTYFL